jgi:hypothetical protein
MLSVRTILSALLLLTACDLCDVAPPEQAQVCEAQIPEAEIEPCVWSCVTGEPVDITKKNPCATEHGLVCI